MWSRKKEKETCASFIVERHSWKGPHISAHPDVWSYRILIPTQGWEMDNEWMVWWPIKNQYVLPPELDFQVHLVAWGCYQGLPSQTGSPSLHFSFPPFLLFPKPRGQREQRAQELENVEYKSHLHLVSVFCVCKMGMKMSTEEGPCLDWHKSVTASVSHEEMLNTFLAETFHGVPYRTWVTESFQEIKPHFMHLSFYCLIFRARQERRVKHQFVVLLTYTFTGWFSYVPWQGIEPEPKPSVYCDNALTHRASNQGRESHFRPSPSYPKLIESPAEVRVTWRRWELI